MNNEKIKGIWIPTEILQDNRFDLSAKVILAIYKYYTIEGELHCCILTNEQLADMIGISVPTVQRAKRKLKELNLIKTNNGIKVWYKGYQNDTHNNQEQGYQNDTHNKERKKNKKRNNKDTYNLSTLVDKSTTSDISTSKGDYDDEDLEYMERYGIGKLSYILQHNDDWLPAMEYLQKHPTKSNYDKIEAYWSNNNEYLGYLHNFNNNTLRITV